MNDEIVSLSMAMLGVAPGSVDGAVASDDESSPGRLQGEKLPFLLGEKVLITDGPFLDFVAAVEAVTPDRTKATVAVKMLGRLTPVQLDVSQIEKL